MQPHPLPLVRRQRPRLVPDPQRDRDPPEVVDERRAAHAATGSTASSRQRSRGRARQLAPPRPSGRRGTARRGRRSRPSPPARGRSPRRRGSSRGPGSAASTASQAEPSASSARISGDVVGEQRGDRRVEGMPGPLAHDPRRALRPADACAGRSASRATCAIRTASGISSPRARPSGALAVPALGEVGEQPLDRRRQPEPVGQHLATSHERRDVPPVTPDRARQLAGDLRRARRRRSRPAARARAGCRARTRAATRTWPAPSASISADSSKRSAATSRVGGAADVEQQARVVGLRRGLGVDAEPLAQPHRHQRALEPVLEREPGARGPWPVTGPRSPLRHARAPRPGMRSPTRTDRTGYATERNLRRGLVSRSSRTTRLDERLGLVAAAVGDRADDPALARDQLDHRLVDRARRPAGTRR